ncbi:hypothetical protein HW132_26915 [Brasilonema sp. CT11]|nr:hypothetical protein [Brasilonema sp. CT11]
MTLTGSPFGFASRLRRETLPQRWTHQFPTAGNPLAGLDSPMTHDS